MTEQEIRVLSIENNPADALLIQERLVEGTMMGWQLPIFVVEWTKCLEKGLARLKAAEAGEAEQIDVVLTDLDLPDSRAGETFDALRQQFPHLPIVVLTGREDEELARASVQVGAQDYLFKNEATGGLLAHALIYAIDRQENAQALQAAHDALERRVEVRTAELQQVNAELRAEVRARRQAEHALQRERDRAERYLNIAPSIIIALDREGRVTLLNEMGAEILECDQQAIIGKDWFETFIPKQNREEIREIFRRLISGEAQPPGYAENTVLTGQGDERIIRWRNVPLKNKAGEVTGLLSAGEDVTARKQMEEALRERIKEQTCLYAVSRDIQKDLPMNVLCRRAVEHLTDALQFPEITVSVIELENRRFTTGKADQTLSHGLQADIYVGDETRGHLTVYYTEKRPFLLPEEQDLINGVAEALSVALERKEAEAALSEREARLRFQAQLLDSFRESIMATDLEGHLTYWGRGAEALYGYRAEEVLGKSVTLIVEPDKKAEELERMQIVRETGAWQGQYQQRRKDGSTFWADAHIALVTDQEGNPTGMIGIDRDITARKEAEAALRESERNLAEAQRIAHMGSWEMDLTTGSSQWSDEFFRICGYAPGAFEPTLERGLSIIHPDDRASAEAALQAALENGRPYYIEKRIVRPDGEVRDVLANGEIVHDDAGQPVKLVGTFLDVTERKRAEKELARYAAELKRRNEALRRFAHLVSDDMQGLVQDVQGSLERMKIRGQDSRDEQDEGLINRALHSIHEMQETIKVLLDLPDEVDVNGRTQ